LGGAATPPYQVHGEGRGDGATTESSGPRLSPAAAPPTNKRAAAEDSRAPVQGESAQSTSSQPDDRAAIFRLPLVERPEPALRLLWASRRIRHLLDAGRNADAIALAKHHNLLCAGAAFVAWDEAEQVPLAQRELYQPSAAQKFIGRNRAARVQIDSLAESSDVFNEFLGGTFGAHPAAAGRFEKRLEARGIMDSSPRGQERLWTILTKRPQTDALRFLPTFGLNLCKLYKRFSGSRAFPQNIVNDDLILILIEWVVDGAADTAQRMRRLEQLCDTLEAQAPTPEAGLAITRQWLTQSMPAADPCRDRVEKMLESIAQRLAECRERERQPGSQPVRP
jgi:hypothetical protein